MKTFDASPPSVPIATVLAHLQLSSLNAVAHQAIAAQILAWTNGQPILTQRLWELMNANATELSASSGKSEPWVEAVNQVVQAHFHPAYLDAPPAEDSEAVAHLQALRTALLTDDGHAVQRLQDYQAVLLARHCVPLGACAEQQSLLEMGLLTLVPDGGLKVANPIYRRVFSPEWVDQHLQQPFVSKRGQWLLLTSLLSILAFIVMQSAIRYSPIAPTHRCQQETDLRDAIRATISLDSTQMLAAIDRLQTLQQSHQLSDTCQTILHDLQYSYAIYMDAGSDNNPLNAAKRLCTIPEAYFMRHDAIPWFSRWLNLYQRTPFAAELADYTRQYPCPAYAFLTRQD